jgi:hypothetical protein
VRGAYRQSTRVLAALTLALGVTLIILTFVRGGGPLALGVVVGAGFVVIGAGRLYLASQR